jgi:hypothetical protein
VVGSGREHGYGYVMAGGTARLSPPSRSGASPSPAAAGFPRPPTPWRWNRAGHAILELSSAQAVGAFGGQATGSVHLILDVSGYFE